MKQEAKRGLLVSITEEGEGFRISLDDIVNDAKSEKIWIQKEHVTSKVVARSAFQAMEFDEKELADFGYYILARISAFFKQGDI